MSRARNGLALLAAAGAGVGALLRRRRPSDDDAPPAAPAAPGAAATPESPASAAGDEAVMTYPSPGQVAAYEEAHGGGMNWAATGGMEASRESSGAGSDESAPEPPSDAGS